MNTPTPSQLRRHRAPIALLVILLAYLLMGALYAWQTPPWQTPDEPAHFNYVQYVAQHNRLPLLQAGDYPHEYLERIKAARFPPDMSIAPLRYESHQPPLYYVLAAFVYRATAGLSFDLQLLVLRLFSLLLGAATLWVTYRALRESFPDPPSVALAATAFVATVPMHLAITAAINNDALAGLLLALLLWQAVRVMHKGPDRRSALAMGVLLGLVLLTKSTIYLVAGGTVLCTAWLGQPSAAARPRLRARVSYLAVVVALALIIALPFFVRNVHLYGGLDILGWQRHDSIVAGQLRTVDLIAQTGWASFARRLVFTTFRSFWAQFGWMGVLVDQRIYLALALWSALLAAGLGIFLLRLRRQGPRISPVQSRILLLLALVTALSLLTYLGYNLKFVQHQGRYLFSALVPLGLAASFGLHELLRPRTARPLAAVLLLATVALFIRGILGGDVFVWGLLLLGTAAAFLASAGWVVTGHPSLLAAMCYVAALALDAICLFGYIVPALRL